MQRVVEQGAVGRAGHCSTAECVVCEAVGAGSRFSREAVGKVFESSSFSLLA